MDTTPEVPQSDVIHPDLRGKTVVITGGAKGIGYATAQAFVRQGARVALLDMDPAALAEAVAGLHSAGGEALAAQASVTDADAVERAFAQVEQAWGRIDVLVNNAGISANKPTLDVTVDEWRRAVDINLTGVFLTCKHVLPVMLAQGGGSIVNISSLASIQVNTYPYTSYYAAKAGLNHLTRALAVRYAPDNIRVNAVLPGVMDTPLIYAQIAGQFEDVEEMRRRRNAASPMGRMGDAWDVAHAALFLASDEARYITGVCLPVDGGKSCAGR